MVAAARSLRSPPDALLRMLLAVVEKIGPEASIDDAFNFARSSLVDPSVSNQKKEELPAVIRELVDEAVKAEPGDTFAPAKAVMPNPDSNVSCPATAMASAPTDARPQIAERAERENSACPRTAEEGQSERVIFDQSTPVKGVYERLRVHEFPNSGPPTLQDLLSVGQLKESSVAANFTKRTQVIKLIATSLGKRKSDFDDRNVESATSVEPIQEALSSNEIVSRLTKVAKLSLIHI